MFIALSHIQDYKNITYMYSFCSGHDGSVRTWKVSQRSHACQEHTLVFQQDENDSNYSVNPPAIEHVVALPTGRHIAASSENVLNIWPLNSKCELLFHSL